MIETCTDCGHLLANHDAGWCYSCASAARQCRHEPMRECGCGVPLEVTEHGDVRRRYRCAVCSAQWYGDPVS